MWASSRPHPEEAKMRTATFCYVCQPHFMLSPSPASSAAYHSAYSIRPSLNQSEVQNLSQERAAQHRIQDCQRGGGGGMKHEIAGTADGGHLFYD